MTSLSPEISVLLACVLDPDDARSAQRLAGALERVREWGTLDSAAARYCMTALLYHRVAETCPGAVPAEVLAAWRDRSVAVARRSLRMIRQLIVMLDRLDGQEIPALALKGPVVSELAHGDPTARQFVDLDVLVRPGDVAAAVATLLASGFARIGEWETVSWHTAESCEQEMGFVHQSTGLSFELHWRIGPRFAPDSLLADELFARSSVVSLLGREVPTLGRADTVLALTLHAATHDWARLEDVATLCGLLRTFDESEWATLKAAAAQHRCRKRLAVGLLVAQHLGELRIPLSSTGLLDVAGAEALALEAAHRLLAELGVQAQANRFRRAAGVFWQARLLDTRRACLAHLWRRLMTPGANDWRQEANSPGIASLASLGLRVRRQQRLWQRR